MLQIKKPAFILMLTLQFLLAASACAQNEWHLKKNQNGIRVYTANTEGSLFKAFRSVYTLRSTGIQEVTAAILDIENYDRLFPDTRDVILLEKKADHHYIHYMVTDAPWPVEDRDGIYELKASFDAKKRMVVAEITCIRHQYPMKKGVIRMNRGKGLWQITELPNNQVEVIYQYHGEPEGSVPAWLANASVISIPYQTMKNLQKIIESGKYRNADMPFIF
jgi:hypothetical protein